MNKCILTNARGLHDFFHRERDGKTLASLGWKLILLKDVALPPDLDRASVQVMVIGAPQTLTKKFMKLFPNLRLISTVGVGYDHIDLRAAKKQGVLVFNVPKLHAKFGAETVIAFIFSLAKNLLSFTHTLRRGVWQRDLTLTVAGKKLGIVGLGNIGKEVAIMATGLGMQVYAYDISYDQAFLKKYPVKKAGLKELLAESDFVSLHIPLTGATKNLLGAKNLALMKPTAYLINTARGEVVEEKALLKVLEKGVIAGAALDVFSSEPPFSNPVLHKLINHPRTIVTPHIATNTREWREASFTEICKNIADFDQGKLDNVSRVT